MLSKLIATAVFGTAWTLLAAGDTLASMGVTAILAGTILWLVKNDRKLAREAIKATNRSAAAVEELTRELRLGSSPRVHRGD